MKVRIGYGLGTGGLTGGADGFGALVDGLEGHRFDSLWLSERVSGDAPDPVIGLAVAAGRTRRLKLGMSVMVLPGRNPVLVAKELASLDVLSNGRLLPAFGLGIADPLEQQAFGVERKERAAIFDEALTLIRRLWAEETVDHGGPRYPLTGMRVRPHPVQQPLDVWLGGRAPSELRRVGRMGDGWLPSFSTPEQVAAGREIVEAAAADAGRTIDPEHFGALIPYLTTGELPDRLRAALALRNPDVDPGDVIPASHDAAAALIERFVAVGFSKFVLVPAAPVPDWDAELRRLADVVLPLQT